MSAAVCADGACPGHGEHPAAEHAAQHTPGPWAVAKEFNDWPAVHTNRGDGKDNDCIAIVDLTSEDNLFLARWPEVDGEAEANARLIAAAPELLEATEALLRAVTAFFDEDATDVNFAAPQELAEKAIARAKGASP